MQLIKRCAKKSNHCSIYENVHFGNFKIFALLSVLNKINVPSFIAFYYKYNRKGF